MDSSKTKKLLEIISPFGNMNEVTMLGHEINEFINSDVFRDNPEQLKSLCNDLAKEESEIKAGYRMRFESPIEYEGERLFEGPHFVLLNRQNETIAIMNFRFGWPLHVRFVQCLKKGAARQFYNETGKFFWEPLIDRIIEIVHKNFPKYGGQKIVLDLNAPGMNEKLKIAIVRKYCPKTAAQLFTATTKSGKEKLMEISQRARKIGIPRYNLPIKHKCFSRLRRGLPMDRKQRPLPKRKPF